MKRSTLDLVITLPWLAAAVVLLVVARLDDNAREQRLALAGSALICFSIGCQTRTSAGLHEIAERRAAAAAPPLPPPAPTPPSTPPLTPPSSR